MSILGIPISYEDINYRKLNWKSHENVNEDSWVETRLHFN